MKIKLDNMEDREGCVVITCDDQNLAREDQSIDGCRWECPSDMVIAYAMTMDRHGLLEELEDQGYEVDDSEYTPPAFFCLEFIWR